jgi:hypothetical protein
MRPDESAALVTVGSCVGFGAFCDREKLVHEKVLAAVLGWTRVPGSGRIWSTLASGDNFLALDYWADH